MSCTMSCSFAPVSLPVIVTLDKANLFPTSQFNCTADFLTECGKLIAKQGALYAYSHCSNAGNNMLAKPQATAICDRGE